MMHFLRKKTGKYIASWPVSSRLFLLVRTAVLPWHRKKCAFPDIWSRRPSDTSRFSSADFQLKLLNLLLAGYFLNHSAYAAEFFFKPLISPLDIYDIVNNCNSICSQPCNTQCCTRPKVRGAYPRRSCSSHCRARHIRRHR